MKSRHMVGEAINQRGDKTMPINSRPIPFLAAAAMFGAYFMPAAGLAEPQNLPAVAITVTDIESHDGFIMVALHDETGWGGAPVDVAREPARGDTVTLTLAAPAPGRYGIRLFHDVDSNGELNTNMVGIPTEPFGFSNNAPPRFGPPSFTAAAFDVGGDGAEQTISLQ